MSEILKKTVERLPEILSKNAAGMMQRMIEATQAQLAADPRVGSGSFTALLLKTSSAALVREFEAAMREAMLGIQEGAAGFGIAAPSQWLSIEPLHGGLGDEADAFASSTAEFDRLSVAAGRYGVQGLGAYGKSVFVSSLTTAFSKAHFDAAETEKVMPFVRQALDGELFRLYAKLRSLVTTDNQAS